MQIVEDGSWEGMAKGLLLLYQYGLRYYCGAHKANPEDDSWIEICIPLQCGNDDGRKKCSTHVTHCT